MKTQIASFVDRLARTKTPLDTYNQYSFSNAYNDVGLGLRIRFSRFVKFELNTGIAYALTDVGDGARYRFFATGRR